MELSMKEVLSVTIKQRIINKWLRALGITVHKIATKVFRMPEDLWQDLSVKQILDKVGFIVHDTRHIDGSTIISISAYPREPFKDRDEEELVISNFCEVLCIFTSLNKVVFHKYGISGVYDYTHEHISERALKRIDKSMKKARKKLDKVLARTKKNASDCKERTEECIKNADEAGIK